MESRIAVAIERFSNIGSLDPRLVVWEGREAPRQLVESTCLTHFIGTLETHPSEALRLAAHCQHLRRFAFPRRGFPEGRVGYLAWRKEAARRSSEQAADILRSVGIPEPIIDHVKAIVTKRERQLYPDVQTMEDALCLTFFRLDASEFALKHDAAAVARILTRTWQKMSERGKSIALGVGFLAPLDRMLRELGDTEDPR